MIIKHQSTYLKFLVLGIFVLANKITFAQSYPKIKETSIVIEHYTNLEKSDIRKNIIVIDSLFTPEDFRNQTNGCKIILVSSDIKTENPGVYNACFMAVNGNNTKSIVKCLTIKVVTICSSTNEIDKKISVYPNPSHGNFTLTFLDKISKDLKINITSLSGDTITSYSYLDVIENKLKVGVKPQISGVYYIVIENNLEVITKKITLLKSTQN